MRTQAAAAGVLREIGLHDLVSVRIDPTRRIDDGKVTAFWTRAIIVENKDGETFRVELYTREGPDAIRLLGKGAANASE